MMTARLTAAILAVSIQAAFALTPSEEKLLRGADARIQQHRTAEVALKLIGPDGKPATAEGKAKIEQASHAFLFGCNIFALGRVGSAEENEAYAKYYAELLNYATLPFYWWGYETQRGKPDHARIEEIAAWCREHHVTMKGHPLAWNYFDPRWIPSDTDLAMSLQMGRISREVGRFKGTIGIWDVVNEATAYDRKECFKNSPVLTKVIREQGVGPYVRKAFQTARAANPDATLVINDYKVEEDYAAKVIDELVDDAGKPLYDVIGIQSHQHGGAWPVQRIWEVCERFKRYGKPLHFTETTFLSGKQGWNLTEATPGFKWESTPEGEQRQAEDVTRFYTMLFSHPAVEAITWWDFCDKVSWQRAPAGLIGRDLKPKPAYLALKEFIKGKWWTRTTASVGEGGAATFRGFYGEYKVTIGDGASAITGTFTLSKPVSGPIEVRLK